MSIVHTCEGIRDIIQSIYQLPEGSISNKGLWYSGRDQVDSSNMSFNFCPCCGVDLREETIDE